MAAKKSAKKKSNSKIDYLKKNIWTISTVVLAVLLLIAIANGSVSGAAISSSEAGQKIVEFASQQGAEATLVSVEDEGSLYQVVVSIQGQEVPVYITKDGKSLIPQTVSLEEAQNQQPAEKTQSAPVAEVSAKSDKPVVEAFVMSHCPYGTQIEKGLLPVMRLLDDKIDAEIKFVYYAMHPTYGEVEEQLNQYCIQSEQNDKYLDYLECFLEAGDKESCLASTEIDMDALETCTTATDKEYNVMANLADTSSWLSGRYPKFDIYKADNEKYSVGGSPTLVINGETVQTGRDSNSLLAAVCSAFNVAPEECETEFEAVTPSPGFGYSTTDVTNNAMCG